MSITPLGVTLELFNSSTFLSFSLLRSKTTVNVESIGCPTFSAGP